MVEQSAATARRNRWTRRSWPIAGAIGAGVLMLLAFPPVDMWWIAPFGVALLALTTYGRGFWAGAGLGLITGLSLLIPLLSWAGGFVGAVWLFLPFGESAYFALLGGLSAVATSALRQRRWTWPLVTGSLWVLQEALRDRTPFGGFPWGRLAFSQGDSPLLGLAAIGGAPLVTFGVGAVGGLLALAWQCYRRGEYGPRGLTGAVVAAVVVTVAPWPTPLLQPTATQTARIAIVQGNVPRLGLEFNAQRRAVLDNHVSATLELARRIRAGETEQPDLVVWPENSSDIDPLINPDASALITQAAQAVGAPILVGGLQEGPGPMDIRNVGLVWDPQQGPIETYTKRHPVPFAEYIPLRSLVRHITTKVDMVRHDFLPGSEPGVLTLGPAVIGDVICFEVAYDEVVRDTVTGGAQLLVVQTNNATFNEAEARQQLAMVRLRAVEHGRSALMASTVGVSAFVDSRGNVYNATQFNAKAVIERTMPLSTSRTIATRLELLPEVALVLMAIGFVAAAIALRRPRVSGHGAGGAGSAGVSAPISPVGGPAGGQSVRTEVVSVANGADRADHAQLAGVSVGMAPLDARLSGAPPQAVVDEARG